MSFGRYLLLYPHKPLVKTRTIDLIGYEQLPAGHNATVSVMSYSGYDIEDALILNKASLDRGFGRCMVLKKFSCALKKYPNGTQDRAMPPQKPDTKDEKARRRAQMSKVVDKFKVVDEDGICGVGMRLEHNDVLVNKFTPTDTRGDLGAGMDPEQLPDSMYRPSPFSYKGPLGHRDTYVDRVMISNNKQERCALRCASLRFAALRCCVATVAALPAHSLCNRTRATRRSVVRCPTWLASRKRAVLLPCPTCAGT